MSYFGASPHNWQSSDLQHHFGTVASIGKMSTIPYESSLSETTLSNTYQSYHGVHPQGPIPYSINSSPPANRYSSTINSTLTHPYFIENSSMQFGHHQNHPLHHHHHHHPSIAHHSNHIGLNGTNNGSLLAPSNGSTPSPTAFHQNQASHLPVNQIGPARPLASLASTTESDHQENINDSVNARLMISDHQTANAHHSHQHLQSHSSLSNIYSHKNNLSKMINRIENNSSINLITPESTNNSVSSSFLESPPPKHMDANQAALANQPVKEEPGNQHQSQKSYYPWMKSYTGLSSVSQ